MSRQFPVTATMLDGSNRTVIVGKQATANDGELFTDRFGRRYVKRPSGLGVVELESAVEASSTPSAALTPHENREATRRLEPVSE